MQKPFNKLSKRQRAIMQFMAKYNEEEGYPPTIREIGKATDINSTSVVNYNLNKLVEAGYVERSERVSRGLRVVGDVPGACRKNVKVASAMNSVPLIGVIVASSPVEVPDDYYYDEDDCIDVSPALLGGIDPSGAYALKVKGDSMIDAMIQDGDIVIMKKQDTARNGDMVAVWLSERSETTLKHFYLEGDRIRLQPAHPMMQPIYVDARHCQIMGRVLGVMRQLSL